MRAGLLRQLIEVQTPVEAVSSDGQRTYTYTTSGTNEWASVRNTSQSKNTDGDIQAAGNEMYLVRIRYRADVGYDTRIIYNGKTMQVVGIENVNERDRELRLDCEVIGQ